MISKGNKKINKDHNRINIKIRDNMMKNLPNLKLKPMKRNKILEEEEEETLSEFEKKINENLEKKRISEITQ